MNVTACRICGSGRLAPVLDLGCHPASDRFLSAGELEEAEPRHPLVVVFCESCGLLQLGYEVDRGPLFSSHYLYASSASTSMTAHLGRLAGEIVERFGLAGGSLAVDIGSNDGTLLRALAGHGLRTVGVDPCPNVAALALAKGIATVAGFWGLATARSLRESHGRASVVTGTNVFAHAADLREFVSAAAEVLDDDGVLVLEFPYVVDLLDGVEFDTIYHEHLCYLSLAPLRDLFGSLGWRIFDVQRLGVHGGSVRLFAQGPRSRWPATGALADMIDLERARGVRSVETYRAFARSVRRIREEARALLGGLNENGHRVAGYGAAAKGNTFLNYCGLGPEDVAYIVDRNPLKNGLFSPGAHIPVRPPAALVSDRPDYLLILPWNWKDEIIAEQRPFAEAGGRFLVGIPRPRILGDESGSR
jgi:novobiocin biosynthesis protein NovU/D-mycarose 3-C-methyltransferase